jgi:16S rRNA (guanine1516-N2)-methyltransferase
MVSNHRFRLSTAARLSACCYFIIGDNNYFIAAAYSIPFADVRRCSILHCSTVLRSHSDPIREIDTVPSDDHTSSDGQRVAVLLPPSFGADNDDDNIKWQHEAKQHLRRVATKSKLPVISLDEQSSNIISSYTHLLMAVPCPRTKTYAIAIHANPPMSKKKSREKKQTKLKLDPFFVDLCPSSDTRLGYRMNLTSNKSGGGSELLLKALGMKKMLSSDKQQLVIYDLTAGLARDSMIMLSSAVSDISESTTQHCRLHMVERDPLVASLLTDAMRRLDILAGVEKNSNEDNNAKLLKKCLSMEEGDAVSVLKRLADAKSSTDSVPYPPDILYLDPMFPPRKKKVSAVKKDMAMLHSLLGTATMEEDKHESEEAEKVRLKEEQQLLAAACNAATRRVVVKRPANALPLGFFGDESESDNVPAPSYDIRGNINRWDVYIIR